MVVTERTRIAIWQQMLDVARVTRYYGTLADRYQRRQRLIRSLLLVSAIGGIAPLVTELPETLQHVASVGIGLLVVLDFLFDYAHKAAVLGTISSECGALEIDLQELWLGIQYVDEEADDAEAVRDLSRLSKRASKTTEQAKGVGVEEDRELNEESAREAYTVVAARYAT